jgi:hypothetical protein
MRSTAHGPGGVLRSKVDRQQRRQSRCAPGATGLRSSPARARKDESDEAKPMESSPVHEQWR